MYLKNSFENYFLNIFWKLFLIILFIKNIKKIFNLYLIILFLPLLSFFVNIFSRIFGRKISSIGSVILICISCLVSLIIFYEIFLCHSIVYLKLFDWVEIGLVNVSFGLLFDSLASIMVVIILWISFFVHFYSLGYMGHDPYLNRFMSYLSLFTFFMLVLVTADNFIHYFLVEKV